MNYEVIISGMLLILCWVILAAALTLTASAAAREFAVSGISLLGHSQGGVRHASPLISSQKHSISHEE